MSPVNRKLGSLPVADSAGLAESRCVDQGMRRGIFPGVTGEASRSRRLHRVDIVTWRTEDRTPSGSGIW